MADSGPENLDSTQSISFRGKLTVADIKTATALVQPLGNKIAAWVVCGFFLVGALTMSGIAISFYLDEDLINARLGLGVALFFWLIPLAAFGRNLYYNRCALKLEREGKWLYAPFEGNVTSESIQTSTESVSGTEKWSGLGGYRQDDQMLLLFEEFGSYQIFKPSFFESETDWNAFVALVQLKLKPR